MTRRFLLPPPNPESSNQKHWIADQQLDRPAEPRVGDARVAAPARLRPVVGAKTLPAAGPHGAWDPQPLIHWKTADVCILTTIEMKLRGHPKAGTREQGGFIQRMGALVGWHMTDDTAARLGWGLSYMGLALCALRLQLGNHFPW